MAELLPRHGIPPVLASWEAYAEALAWLDEPGQWWWEVRPHPAHGTLELRTPDAQATVEDAEAIVAVAHALVVWLAERHAAGEVLRVDEDWRIRENAWSAARFGLEGELADLAGGRRAPTRERLHALLDELAPVARGLGGERGLSRARALVEEGGGAARQRAIAREGGVRAVVADIAARFTAPRAG